MFWNIEPFLIFQAVQRSKQLVSATGAAIKLVIATLDSNLNSESKLSSDESQSGI